MSLILKIIGLFNSLYLVYLHQNLNKSCGFNGACSEVIGSVYGAIGGIPLAAFGVSLYIVLLLIELYLYSKDIDEKSAESLNMCLLIPATAIGLILIGVQVFYIKSFCLFCTINSILLIVLLSDLLIKRKDKTFKISQLQLGVVISIIVLFIFPLVLFKANSKSEALTIGVIAEEEITTKKIKDSFYAKEIKKYQNKIIKLQKKYFEDLLISVAAKKKQMTREKYEQEYIKSTVSITEKEMKDFYEENKHMLKNDESFEVVKNIIRNILMGEKNKVAFKNHTKKLMDDFNAEFYLKPLKGMKTFKNIHQSLSIGNEDAPIKIIEFSDLECGYCKQAFYAVKDIIKKYKDDVYFEYRHFPLPNHKYAKEFAKGSICAEKEGKGFDFIDLTFQNQRNLNNINPVEFAERLGLNINDFESCLIDSSARLILQHDINEGNRIGVDSTPTFIINEELFDGIPRIKDIIDYL